MTGPGQRVQIFSVVPPKKGTPREKRRFLVKWRVDGRDKKRSRNTRPEADDLKRRLQAAVVAGEEFDLVTGYPLSWVKQGQTWWQWSQEYLKLKWPKWSGHSRRSAVESLVCITPFMVRKGAPSRPADLATWLRTNGYLPGSDEWARPPSWLLDWSIPLGDIDGPLVEDVLAGATTKLDGSAVSREVARRRMTMVKAVLTAARRRRLMDHNPLDEVEWELPVQWVAVDISTVPGPGDVQEVVDHVAVLKSEGARYAAFLESVGVAGMRPSEALGLMEPDLALPDEGWGLAILRGATTSPGTRFTAAGTVVEDKALKQRPAEATREVPLSPLLVRRIRWHMDRWPPVNGRIFTNAAGRPVTSTNYGPVWVRARGKVWPDKHRFSAVTVYDLRHAAATMMLRAGVPPAEVAKRLGHSVEVLMRIYAGVFDDERERSNDLIDRSMHAAMAAKRAKRAA